MLSAMIEMQIIPRSEQVLVDGSDERRKDSWVLILGVFLFSFGSLASQWIPCVVHHVQKSWYELVSWNLDVYTNCFSFWAIREKAQRILAG